MRLVSLEFRCWRNLAQDRLDTDARFVVLHGDNAQGKTNLLEAAWMLGTLRSFREHRPRRLVRHGEQKAALIGQVEGISGRRELRWELDDGSRSLALDGRSPSGLGDWFAVLRAILFCPEDAALVRAEPAVRRRFLDRAAFTARPGHLDIVRDYRRVLAQKSALLRDGGSAAALAPWNARLAVLGARLACSRQRVLDELTGPVQALHARIAGSTAAPVGLRVRGLGQDARDEAAVAEAIRRALHEKRGDELRRGMSLVGPHRDDLHIALDGRPARNYASQGQARSLVLALKLAELVAARERGEAPLFLLDDLTSELDRGRMRRLIDVLGELQSQVWLTTTDPAWLGPLPADSTLLMQVVDGRVERVEGVDERGPSR